MGDCYRQADAVKETVPALLLHPHLPALAPGPSSPPSLPTQDALPVLSVNVMMRRVVAFNDTVTVFANDSLRHPGQELRMSRAKRVSPKGRSLQPLPRPQTSLTRARLGDKSQLDSTVSAGPGSYC